MIPVQRQPEPPDFDRLVRQRGSKFLANAQPSIQWRGREYWRDVLPDLYVAYGGYCAYLALKIPQRADGGEPTVDHFLPKSLHPTLAYEWSNFRLASALMNSNKGDALGLLDPCELLPGWFELDFPSLLTHAVVTLPETDQERVNRTIALLKLNHLDIRLSRKEWIVRYATGGIPFAYLAEIQPFVAQELQRQALTNVDILCQMFGIDPLGLDLLG